MAQAETPYSPSFIKRLKKIALGVFAILAVVLLVAQFLAFISDHTNPPVIEEPNWDSPETRQLAERACFDCHSNETVWPWYSRVFPVSVMLENDVKKGREVLNFSEWVADGREQASTEDIVESISKGIMPLSYYLITHPESRLSDSEQGALINGLIETTESGDGNLEAIDADANEGEEDGE